MLLMLKLLILSILLSSSLLSALPSSQKTALVIINADYTSFPSIESLKKGDEKLIHSLKKRDFHVVYLKNATKKLLKQRLEELAKKLPKKSTFLLYYAGYVLNSGAENLLVMSDSSIIDMEDISNETFSLSKLLNSFESDSSYCIIDAYRVESIQSDNSDRLALIQTTNSITSSEVGKQMPSAKKPTQFEQKVITLLNEKKSLKDIFSENRSGETLVQRYIEKNFSDKDKINIEIIKKIELKQLYMWYAYITEITHYNKHIPTKQRVILYSDSRMVVENLLNPESGRPYSETLFTLPKKYYKKRNLLYGDGDAKHKVVIFSDPMCPTCKKLVPPAVDFMKKYPKKYAIYYYHLPVVSVHPASVVLAKATLAAQLQGLKDIALSLYDLDIDPLEKDEKIILNAFNTRFGVSLQVEDIDTDEIEKMYAEDIALEKALKIKFTPTFYVDGKIDHSKELYKTLK